MHAVDLQCPASPDWRAPSRAANRLGLGKTFCLRVLSLAMHCIHMPIGCGLETWLDIPTSEAVNSFSRPWRSGWIPKPRVSTTLQLVCARQSDVASRARRLRFVGLSWWPTESESFQVLDRGKLLKRQRQLTGVRSKSGFSLL
jgi:hypothetical protein